MASSTQNVTNVSNVTFSSIPATCQTLIIDYTLTGTGGAINGQFNNVTTNTYDYVQFYTGTSQAANPAGFVSAQSSATFGLAGIGSLGGGRVIIQNYTSTSQIKMFTSESGRRDNSTQGYYSGMFGDWNDTPAAINIVKILPIGGGSSMSGTVTISGQ